MGVLGNADYGQKNLIRSICLLMIPSARAYAMYLRFLHSVVLDGTEVLCSLYYNERVNLGLLHHSHLAMTLPMSP